MADYRILLERLELTIGLGIHPEERAAPQRVRIDVALDCRYPAQPEDRIDAVVDYDFLRTEILNLAKSRHFELQETLCDQIAMLALTDPRVMQVRVKSMKLNIYPDARIGCEVLRKRE